jgi:hypothetical protein
MIEPTEGSALDKLLNDLEAKAEKAAKGRWFIKDGRLCCTVEAGEGSFLYLGLDNAENREHIASANPETVKRLIAIIRRQHDALEFYGDERKDFFRPEPLHKAVLVCDKGERARQAIADVEALSSGSSMIPKWN